MKTRSHLFITLILISNLVFAQEKWSLEKCLSHANENNLQILAARLNEQTQEYNYKIAGNQQLPDVNVSLNSGLVFEPQMLSNQADYQYSKIFQNSGSLIVSAPLSNGGMLRLNKE
ncbi:MAG: TolC family protein, partial [Flavobacteriaceae bacterium]|nr:TolC family protein [Flavobacteriaceae bacterium]